MKQYKTYINSLSRLTNQIYKLLPLREEGYNWRGYLSTILVELQGMRYCVELDGADQNMLFSLLCKLSGLKALCEDEDFFLYRRTIFECLGIVKELSLKWADTATYINE